MRTVAPAFSFLFFTLHSSYAAVAAAPRLPPVPDSLRAAYQAAPRPDAARLAVLLRIATAYIEPLDSAGVLDYARAAEHLARQLGDTVGVGQAVDVRGHFHQQLGNQALAAPLLERAARLLAAAPAHARATSHYHLGWLYGDLGQPGRALRHYRRAYALFGQTGDAAQQGEVLNSCSLVYSYRQQFDSAQYFLLRALRLQQRLGRREAEAATLSNLAGTFELANQLPEAARYARQAATLQQALGDYISLAATLNTLGHAAQLRDSLPLARRYFRASLALGRRHGLDAGLATGYSGLADVAAKLGQPDSAEHYYLRAIGAEQRAGNTARLPVLMSVLAQFYAYRLHRLPAAVAWATRARALDQATGSPDPKPLEVLAFVAEAQHDYARALRLHQQLDTVRAEILARNNERLTQELRIGFDTERAEQRVALLEKDQQLAWLRQQRALGAALAVLLLLAGLFGAYRRRQRGREASLRHQLAADLHDDVGALLSQIALQTDLLHEGLTPASQQPGQWAQVAGNSRLAVRQLNDVVWNLDAANDTVPNLLDRLRDYAHEVLVPSGRDVRFVADEATGVSLELSALVRRQLYLIYKEALHNILKYAPADTLVTVTLNRDRAGLRLAVVNSGPVCPGPGRSSGHGLRNICERATGLGGTATVGPEPAGGFAVRVQVPVGKKE